MVHLLIINLSNAREAVNWPLAVARKESPSMHASSSRHRRIRTMATALMAGLTLLTCLTGCGTSTASPSAAGSGPLQVVTSINQWQSLAVDLGGDQARVDTILSNTSTDAHDYEPTTADIARISRADLVIVNGAGIDDWAAKAAETGQARMVDISKASGRKAGDNPHLWFSSQGRRAAAKAVYEAYGQLRPDRTADFDRAYQDWQGRQARLDDLIAKARKQTQGWHYAATESAAYYLCHDLGMEDLTPEGYLRAAANESEPSPEDLVAFRHLLSSGRLDMLVLNVQEVNRTSKELAIQARKAHVPVFEVSEQRPEKYRNLEDWISALIHQVPGAKA